MTTPDWSSLADVRRALSQGELRELARAYRDKVDAHLESLLALSPEERVRLAREPRMVSVFAAIGFRLFREGAIAKGWALYDAAIEGERFDQLSLYGNALWTLLEENNAGTPVTPDRAQRYLARCLPYASENPSISVNAACLLAQMGDHDGAIARIRDAVRFGYEDLDAVRKDAALAPLRSDARFTTAFDDPSLLAEQRARRLPTRGSVDWSKVFEHPSPERGATEAELTVLHRLWAPLGEDDRGFFHEAERFEEAGRWVLSGFMPPASYLDFLRFSNGGTFRNGERSFNAFFPVASLRRMMLGYSIPEEMPHVLPFAFDGGGVFYAFDMREPPSGDELPVVAFYASTPVWEEATVVADSFEAACRGTTGV